MPANRLPLRTLPFFFQTAQVKRFSWGKCVFQSGLSDTTRFAIVIPKTTLKLATQRNRLKRQLFASFQKVELSPPLDFVVIVHRRVESTLIDQDIRRLFHL